MTFESYHQLKQFGNSLEKAGIDKISVQPSEVETEKFTQLYDNIRDQFTASLINDLRQLFSSVVTVEKNKFYPEDPDSQGASHIDLKLKLSENDLSFHLKVECIVFGDRIILSHDYPETLDLNLSKVSLNTLRRFHKIGEFNFMSELSLLA